MKVIDVHEGHKNNVALFEAAKEKLFQNPRKKALDEMGDKIQALQKKGRQLREGTEERSKVLQEGEAALEAYRDLNNKWIQFHSEKSKAITGVLVDTSKKYSSEILKIAGEIGEAQGFDWVLEINGQTNSKMPVVLYVKKSTDITDLIIKELSKNAPPKE